MFRKGSWARLAILAVSAFVLNWFWEMLQMPAYTEMAGRTWWDTARLCTLATFADVAITVGIYVVAVRVLGRRVVRETSWLYAVAALLAAITAIAIERWAISAGHWSYNDRMPLVPLAKVGLWPLLQLTFLVPVSIAVARLACPDQPQKAAK